MLAGRIGTFGYAQQIGHLDMALPFGARSSSYSMQQAANFMTRALAKKGINSIMYLDDLFLAARDKVTTCAHYQAALDLITGLGLPIAQKKLQPPARELVWLGITLDLANNTISIPHQKLQEIRSSIPAATGRSAPQIKEVQSLIGSINHLGKAVPPARLFMG